MADFGTLPPVPRGSLINWITSRPNEIVQYLEAVRSLSRAPGVQRARENAIIDGASAPPITIVQDSGGGDFLVNQVFS